MFECWNSNLIENFLKTILLLVIDYNNLVIDYQRVKLFGKRFWEKIHVLLSFWKNFLILIWIESSLDSWILNLDSWFLILEIKFPLDPWSVLDSILNSFLNVIIFVIMKWSWLLSFLSLSLLSSKLLEWILIHQEACFYNNNQPLKCKSLKCSPTSQENL